jgi:parallel beta-helix repeat protein
MNSKSLSLPIALLVALSSFFTILTTLPQDAGATIHYVGGTGPGNHTTILSAILNANPGETVFVHSGTYGEEFEVSKPLNIVGEDVDTTVIMGGPPPPLYVIKVTSSWVNISGFTITNNAFGTKPGGLEVRTADNCNISNNIFLANRNSIHLDSSNNSRIINNTFTDNLRGIYSFRSNDISIEHNNISSNDYGLGLRESHNGTIRRNDISLNTNDGITIDSSYGIVIVNNRISSNGENGIWMDLADEGQIMDNDVTSNSEGAIVIYLSSGVEVVNNDVSYSNWGISFWRTDGSLISGNTGMDSTWGISLEKSSNNILSNNVMIGGGVYFSIENYDLENWNTHDIDTSNTVNGKPVYYWKNVSGGEIPANAGQVILANCTAVTVEYQTINNVLAGIEIGYSSNNTIRNNTISDGILGMFFDHSDNNTIINNTISSQDYFGILLGNSYSNLIYHNSFIDNLNQSGDIGMNSWDNGYPSGGNYWNDYTGVDEKSGQDQDQLGSDEIGDSPYDIFGGVNSDRYPLMSPTQQPPQAPPNEPPNCTISTPAPDELISEIYTVTGTASDSDGHVERVEIRIDGGAWYEAIGNTSWTFEWNTTNVSNGEHTIYARSYDGENYSTVASVTVVVDNPDPPTDDGSQDDWLWLALAVSIIIIVVVMLLFIFFKKRRTKGEEESIEPILEESS